MVRLSLSGLWTVYPTGSLGTSLVAPLGAGARLRAILDNKKNQIWHKLPNEVK